jgi:hypothetical protein
MGHATATATATSALLHEDFDCEDFISSYPDQFGELLSVTQEGELTYYSTEICPIKCAPHSNQPGKGHNCLVVGGPSGIGFECFACSGTFGDVRRLLREQSGHTYDKPIWADDDLDHSFDWWDAEHRTWVDLADFSEVFPLDFADGGVPVWLDDPTQLTRNVTPICTVAEYQEDDEAVAEEPPEETVIRVSCPTLIAIFQYATRIADAKVAKVNPAAQAAFRREVERIIRAREYRRMIEVMGQAMIRELGVEVLTSATPPAFSAPNGDLSIIALDILMHSDDVPLNMKTYTLAQLATANTPPTT